MSQSPALRAALAGAGRIPVCPRCAEPQNQGLCHSERCQRAVLPQLAPNAVNLAAHSGRFGESAESIAELEARAERVSRPKRMAALRRQANAAQQRLHPHARLYAAMLGMPVRNRRSAA